jgi:hypothetical protein
LRVNQSERMLGRDHGEESPTPLSF